MNQIELRKALETALPPLVPRIGIREKFGVPYSAGYLANRDSLGTGPGAIKIGGRVCYEKGALIDLIMKQIEGTHV